MDSENPSGDRVLFSRRRVLIGVGISIAAVALLLVSAHYQAKQRLAACAQELIAQGEKLAVIELIPKRPNPEDNGAAQLLAVMGQLNPLNSAYHASVMKSIQPGRARVSWQQPILPTDGSTNIWPGLRTSLDNNREYLSEAAQALDRPVIDFNPNYPQGFNVPLPHLAQMKSLAQWFSAATVSDLREGNPDQAWNHLNAITALVRKWNEPIMISQLVRIAIGSIAVGVIWEALEYGDWKEEQLAQLQSHWQTIEFLPGMQASLRMERAWGLRVYADARRSPRDLFQTMGGLTANMPNWSEFLEQPMRAPQIGWEMLNGAAQRLIWPWWWSYDDEVRYLKVIQAVNASAQLAIESNNLAAALFHLDQQHLLMEPNDNRYLLGSALGGELFKKMLEKAARMETQRQMIIAVLALKRHRLLQGRYPESLAQLVPHFLPQIPIDFMDGKPLRYRLLPDGTFLLYSVGENATDDGGDPQTAVRSLFWTNGRDWVWPHPAAPEEVQEYHQSLKPKRQPF